MTNKKPTGGPAFPIVVGPDLYDTGLTIRDWFAGMALQGELAGQFDSTSWDHDDDSTKKLAARSYAVADAMLAEREK
jgi:hypothetical protein